MDPKQKSQTLKRREEFNQHLVQILGHDRVHYNAPTEGKLYYPCIMYELENTNVSSAGNKIFNLSRGYKVTHITVNVDESDEVMNSILALAHSSFRTRFNSDGLYHTVYSVYY